MTTTFSGISTVIFDFDGTLYEEPAVYDRFVQEMAAFLPPERRDNFRDEWEQARAGRHAMRVGMGYDVQSDTLFRYDDDRIIARCDWQGTPIGAGQTADPAPAARARFQRPEDPAPQTTAADSDPAQLEPHAPATSSGAPPVETLLSPAQVLNIGDFWGLADALAAHYGLQRAQRAAAFMATRAYMDGPEFPMAPAPGLVDALQHLCGRGIALVAMTNSPPDTTRAILHKLGIWDLFAQVQTMARKPDGMRMFLAEQADPARVLSVGDNFINEIEPALQAGGAALYIDRFATGLGEGQPRCARVGSIPEMADWLRRHL